MENQFDIHSRFRYLEQLTEMVAKEETPSLVVTGEGGLGKTYTVTQKVKAILAPWWKFWSKDKFAIVKGYSTPRGLYNSLYRNNGKLIIYDDCDSVLDNKVSLNILKAALDSSDEREISWNSKMAKNDPIPQKFLFTGRIIFISNKNKASIDQAIVSRSMMVDVSMTQGEKIERMRSVLPSIEKKIPMHIKEHALNFLDQYKEEVNDLNFRTLIKVSKIIKAYPKDWENLALYTIMGGDTP